jgi:hypothetical protein
MYQSSPPRASFRYGGGRGGRKGGREGEERVLSSACLEDSIA